MSGTSHDESSDAGSTANDSQNFEEAINELAKSDNSDLAINGKHSASHSPRRSLEGSPPRKTSDAPLPQRLEQGSPRKIDIPEQGDQLSIPRTTTPPPLSNLSDLSSSTRDASDSSSSSSSAPNTPHEIKDVAANTTPRESTSAPLTTTSSTSTTPREGTSTTPRDQQQQQPPPKTTTPRGSVIFPSRDSPNKHPHPETNQSNSEEPLPHIAIPDPPVKPLKGKSNRIKKATLGLFSPLLKVFLLLFPFRLSRS